jgi:hypothetical protein
MNPHRHLNISSSRTTPSSLFALALSLVACGGSSSESPDAGAKTDAAPSASCLEANNHSDFDWIAQNVFATGCAAFSACHKGAATQAGGLSLEASVAKAQLVGVTSSLFPQFQRVKPSDATNSYLLIVMGHFDGPRKSSGTMPINSPLTCVEKRRAIERWITAGAQ